MGYRAHTVPDVLEVPPMSVLRPPLLPSLPLQTRFNLASSHFVSRYILFLPVLLCVISAYCREYSDTVFPTVLCAHTSIFSTYWGLAPAVAICTMAVPPGVGYHGGASQLCRHGGTTNAGPPW